MRVYTCIEYGETHKLPHLEYHAYRRPRLTLITLTSRVALTLTEATTLAIVATAMMNLTVTCSSPPPVPHRHLGTRFRPLRK